jgi:hypothetical protein
MKIQQLFFLVLICLFAFSCASLSAPSIIEAPSNEVNKQPAVPTEILASNIPIKGKNILIEFDEKSLKPGEALNIFGELISVEAGFLVLKPLNESTALHPVPIEHIETVRVYEPIEKYNAVLYGSVYWLFFPLLTLSHGLFLFISAPTWLIILVDSAILGNMLNQRDLDIDEAFDFNILKTFARYPTQVPLSIQNMIAEKLNHTHPSTAEKGVEQVDGKQASIDQRFTNQSALIPAIGAGFGFKYGMLGVHGNVKYITPSFKLELGLGFTYLPEYVMSGTPSLSIGYIINKRSSISAVAAMIMLQPYRYDENGLMKAGQIEYAFGGGADYHYDIGLKYGFQLVGGLWVFKENKGGSPYVPMINLGVEYLFR